MSIAIIVLRVVVTVTFTSILGSESKLKCWKESDQCPSRSKWKERSILFKCSSPKEYTCILNEDFKLVELCMHVYPISKNTQDCPLISCFEGEPFLKSNFKPCPTNETGCPPEGHEEYRSNELYKYPRCVTEESSKSDGSAYFSMSNIASFATSREPEQIIFTTTELDENTRNCKRSTTELFHGHLWCFLFIGLLFILSLVLLVYVILLKRRMYIDVTDSIGNLTSTSPSMESNSAIIN